MIEGNWLILETSGQGGLVALASNGDISASGLLDASRRHNRDLMLVAKDLVQSQGLTIPQLQGVIVGIGPGSFTGLRVGIITAKMLARALGIPLLAVPTFASLATAVPDNNRSVVVISDALQGLVYVQRFGPTTTQGEARRNLGPLAIAPMLEVAKSVTAGEIVVGPGLAIHGSKLPAEAIRLAEEWNKPQARAIVAVASGLQPLTQAELYALEPLYLRGSSAEEKARKHE